MTIGFLIMALLPVTAAVSTDAVQPPEVPVAITQPMDFSAFGVRSGATLPESAMTILVGSGLLGLASIVRRTTKHS